MDKIGKSLGFVSAEVFNVNTGRLICFGRHMKYLYSNANVAPRPPIKNNESLASVNHRVVPNLDDILNIDHAENGYVSGNISIKNYHRNAMGGMHVS